MDTKYLAIGAVVFAAFVGGLLYLAKLDATTPSSSESRFVGYAEQIGLDVAQFESDIAGDTIAARVNSDLQEGTARGVNSTPSFFVGDQKITLPNSVEGMYDTLTPLMSDAGDQTIPAGTHHKGSDTPKVIITEYSDLQCPACGAYAPTLKKFIAEHGDEVTLVYKHFPLKSIHPFAEAAAKATEAAALQGKFWEMHDILFENQSEWNRGNRPTSSH